MTDERWTVKRILDWTAEHLRQHGSDSPRLEAEILLAHARACPRIELYTRYAEELSEAERATMRELVRRRARAEPVAYLVGRREFYALSFEVSPAVLIPRPETELLVLELLERANRQQPGRVLDLCTGSGCVAVAVAVHWPEARITATDLSVDALAIARQNATRHNVVERVDFLQGDLFAALPAGAMFDFIVSNPPYIRDDELAGLPADVARYEPELALRGGPDGLQCIRRILQGAVKYLRPGGWLMLEMDPAQVEPVCQHLRNDGDWTEITSLRDLAGHQRVVLSRLVQESASPAGQPASHQIDSHSRPAPPR